LIVAMGWLLYGADFDSVTELPFAQRDHLTTNQSIAVLPINNMSNDPELVFFADGIAEEILNNLARYPNLEVASRSSTLAYRGEARDMPAVGAALGVSYLLEGSVRKSGDAIRVTLQLIRATDDEHIWSQTFEQSGDAGFDAQSDVARVSTRLMAANLQVDVFLVRARTFTKNDEAYRHIVRGARERMAMLIGSGGDWQVVLDNFNRALELDPGFGFVPMTLANAYILRLDNTIPLDEALSKANYYLAKAEPFLGQSGSYSAQVAMKQVILEANYKAALTNFDITAARNPDDAWTPAYRGIIDQRLGRNQEAMEHFKRAVDLRPGDAGIRLYYGYALVATQQYETAIKQLKAGFEIAQAGLIYEIGWSLMSLAYHALGDEEAANQAIDQAIKSDGASNPNIDGHLALALSQLGRKQEVADIRRKLSAIAERRFVHPDALFMASLADGDIDAAFSFLEQAILERGAVFNYMRTKYYPYEALQADPRWADMLALVEEIETVP
jgi:adenylate cyclase